MLYSLIQETYLTYNSIALKKACMVTRAHGKCGRSLQISELGKKGSMWEVTHRTNGTAGATESEYLKYSMSDEIVLTTG